MKLTAAKIVELAALRNVDPTNPLADRLITETLDAGEVTPLFFAKLQKAWRDGHLSDEEQLFCEQMELDPEVYLRFRNKLKSAPGETRFDRVKAIVFEL